MVGLPGAWSSVLQSLYVGVEGPVASLRLDCIRNGMEDYDLLLLAESLLGRDWVVEQVK